MYHEITPPERLVQTFEYEGAPAPGHVLLETVTFEDLGDGRTKVTGRSVFQSVDDREAMVKSGMETGARETMERLAELLASR
ncbi:SRPBCC domain-containing protein [Streptomyces sp. RB6PN25]|uniref:SRPBCC domain-containing protein n=1 Tax=Streptomyces humicola TaxID=2953240 RepID=A0ABT1PVR1_9ACTN|nr:SRPBCC domain-containing protein [Streptomyces humicola]MCQ4080647.1 SRPBCC domain-containing protein [Streptomyces humicola]